MQATDAIPFQLTIPDDRSRVIRGRLRGPRAFAVSGERRPHVIVLHGFKGFMDWGFFPDIARRIAGRDMVAVSFNMSGSGIGDDLETFSETEAFAQNTYSRELQDLEVVRAWIRTGDAPGIDPERAALIGHSRGGGVALLHAADHAELRSVVTWASISTVDRFDVDTKTTWRERGCIFIRNTRTGVDQRVDVALLDDIEANRSKLDLEAACRRLAVPTLLIHGTADDAVPPEELEILAACIEARYRSTLLVSGAGHTFGVSHPMVPGRAEAWDTVARATVARLERHL